MRSAPTSDALTLHTTLDGVTSDHLHSFFMDWPNPPTPVAMLHLLRGSQARAVAREPNGMVIGFATDFSDGVLGADLPLLEVRPEWRGQGIASRLIAMVVNTSGDLYMIGTARDDHAAPFCERFGRVRGERSDPAEVRPAERRVLKTKVS